MATMLEKEWLVEIRVRDSVNLPPGQSRIAAYEEVLANNEISARYKAFDQFERRCSYEPIMRRKMLSDGRKLVDYCAPDAVEI